MKLSELYNIRTVLAKYAAVKLPMATAYKMVKFLKATESDGEFYSSKVTEVINKYAETDDTGHPKRTSEGLVIDKDKAEECYAAVQEIQEIETEAPAIKFQASELEPLAISVEDLYKLDMIIEAD